MIVSIIGANRYSVEKELKVRKEEFALKNGNGAIESYFYDQLDPDKLTLILTSSSLFSQNRLVVLKDVSQSSVISDCFLKLADKISDQIDVLLVESKIDKRKAFYKTIKKQFETIEIKEMSEIELGKWISSYTSELGGSISQRDIGLLLRYTGIDQLRIKNELEKLVAYDPQISQESINSLVERSPEDSVFQLLEASLSGKTRAALDILNNLEQAHEDPFAVANMLIWQTHILAIVYSAADVSDSKIAGDTKLKPFVVQKTRALSRRLSAGQYRNIIDTVAQLDINLKSGKNKPWRLLNQAIAVL